MKFNFGVIALLALLTLFAFFATGCSSFQKALEVAERTRAEMEAAGAEAREAYETANTARKRYEAALEEGDGDEITAALAALREAESQARERELKLDATRRAYDTAEAELERARREGNPIETGIGLLLSLVIGGGGGFLAGKRGGRKEALIDTVVEEVKGKRK